ncbi:MAG: YbaB/EbfC family nucleoid-associated protein [Acidimicrobiales bacterium]
MTDSNDDDLPIVSGVAGMPDLGGLLESAQKMMAEAQAAASQIVEGVSGGGLVKVQVDGHFEFHSISIDPSAVDTDDIALLEDLVLAALRDASAQLQSGQQGAMGGLDLGGPDLGGLGGLLGGGDQ